MTVQSMTGWKSGITASSQRGRWLVTLSFETGWNRWEIIRSMTVPGSFKAASATALAWLDEANAGLVPPVPERERVARLAALPLRTPAQVQQHDLSPLPLWSDAHHQAELF